MGRSFGLETRNMALLCMRSLPSIWSRALTSLGYLPENDNPCVFCGEPHTVVVKADHKPATDHLPFSLIVSDFHGSALPTNSIHSGGLLFRLEGLNIRNAFLLAPYSQPPAAAIVKLVTIGNQTVNSLFTAVKFFFSQELLSSLLNVQRRLYETT
ncbi:hypothetical protein EDC04DRAFT_234354 [Pisolithus marmoratus]|nr:hypothetical protein EDC04DRAFT_234354 [Pisolithus marmoratus]